MTVTDGGRTATMAIGGKQPWVAFPLTNPIALHTLLKPLPYKLDVMHTGLCTVDDFSVNKTSSIAIRVV